MTAGPVRIGVLGCAQIVKAVILDPAAETPAISVVAIGSRDGLRAQAYAAEHGIARAHESYQALVDDPEVDVVYNPLPNSLHAEWTIRALEAGKAVLCEKPLASNADEARRMVAAAEAADRPLIEAFHYRHHPVAGLIHDVLRSGELGALRRLDAVLKIGSDRLRPDNIRYQSALAGGATMDLGAYCIHGLRMCVGEEPNVVDAVAVLHDPWIDRTMSARLAFPGGAEATFECSLSADAFETRLVVEGERGTLVCDNPFLPRAGTTVTVEVEGMSATTRFDERPTYVFQARALAAVIREGAPILTSGAAGLANMEVIDAVYRKAGLGPRGGQA